jgi:hypothetical protein
MVLLFKTSRYSSPIWQLNAFIRPYSRHTWTHGAETSVVAHEPPPLFGQYCSMLPNTSLPSRILCTKCKAVLMPEIKKLLSSHVVFTHQTTTRHTVHRPTSKKETHWETRRPKSIWQDNIKTDVKELRCDSLFALIWLQYEILYQCLFFSLPCLFYLLEFSWSPCKTFIRLPQFWYPRKRLPYVVKTTTTDFCQAWQYLPTCEGEKTVFKCGC